MNYGILRIVNFSGFIGGLYRAYYRVCLNFLHTLG